MKDNIALLADYKAEKTIVIGSPEERTGLEEYPHFKEWKAQYVEEYLDTHMTMEEADADELVELQAKEADLELTKLASEFGKDAEAEAEEDDDEDEAPVAKKATKPIAKKKLDVRKAKPPMVNKKNPPLKAKAKPAAKKAAPKAKGKMSKTQKAQNIFNRFYGKKTRAEIILKFQAQCDLTPAGSSTYYQKFRKLAGE